MSSTWRESSRASRADTSRPAGHCSPQAGHTHIGVCSFASTSNGLSSAPLSFGSMSGVTQSMRCNESCHYSWLRLASLWPLTGYHSPSDRLRGSQHPRCATASLRYSLGSAPHDGAPPRVAAQDSERRAVEVKSSRLGSAACEQEFSGSPIRDAGGRRRRFPMRGSNSSRPLDQPDEADD